MLSAAVDLSGFGDVDVVIEAVFEDLELKQGLVYALRPAGDTPGELRGRGSPA